MDKRLHELLTDNNKLFHRIFNSIAEGVVVADVNGEFLYFNKVAEKILGIGMKNVEPEEWSDVYGCFYTDQITPFPSSQLPLVKTIRTGKVCREKVFINNKALPKGIYIDISGSPIMGANNTIMGGIAIFKDITESTHAEMAIRQSEERLKAQFKGFPIPTYVWKNIDGQFSLLDYNNAAEAFTKGQVKQLLGISLQDMYPDQSNPIHADFMRSYEEKKIVRSEMSYELKTTGEKKELNVYYVYIPEDLIVVHTEDTTERRNAEMHLKKLSNAVEQTADAVMITTKEGIIEYINPAFETITGYRKEEVIGQTPRLLKSGRYPKSFYQNLWKTVLDNNAYKSEMINKKKNGELYWVQNTITPMKNADNEITNFVSVTKDITEIKEKKEQEIRLQIAKEIQQRLFTTSIQIPGYDIAGKNFPAHETGGDYFDMILTSENNLWLAIADVSNHGIGPALIMAATRAYLRAFLKVSSDPAVILGMINDALYADLNEYQYVTMLLIRLNTGCHEIEYASAGHVPAFILNKNGMIAHQLDSTGIPLGYLNHEQFNTCKVNKMHPGDILVLLTDGILEAQDSEENEFGHEKTLELINSHKCEKSADIINHIYKEVCLFSGGSNREDDITALICKLSDEDSDLSEKKQG